MAKLTTNNDDWETDPDFIRDMDEMDQRWGSKRTVGSINMNDLIDEVRRDHKNMREKNHHPSQKDYSSSLNRGNLFRPGSEVQEKISRKVVTESSESSYVKETINGEAKKMVVEKSSATLKSKQETPLLAPKPDFIYNVKTEPPKQFKESSVVKRIFEEKNLSSLSSSKDNIATSKNSSTGDNVPQAFKSVQDKIDAFKKEFENIESKVARKSDMSRLIKKTTSVEKSNDNVQYVTRSNERLEPSGTVYNRPTTTSPTRGKPTDLFSSARPSSTSPLYSKNNDLPKNSIKSLSQRFESLGRDTGDDFRRRMEERRKEFFDEIKTQVRETRKGLDGFDIIESDEDDNKFRGQKLHANATNLSTSGGRPKVYTKRETTQEQIVSKLVKENDKIIHDETKRNVEHTSSCHGSSDEGGDLDPSSIKQITREFKSSPMSVRTQSPIDEIKRKIPVVEPSNKGSGLMARTLYDYQAAEEDELTFDVDDLITNIEKLDEGWYKGTITKNGKKHVGLFPANYVKLLNDSSFY